MGTTRSIAGGVLATIVLETLFDIALRRFESARNTL